MSRRKSIPWLRITGIALALIVVAALLFVRHAWKQRRDISDIDWPTAKSVTDPDAVVSVTWLGITTLLFDDGETQIIVGGTFTRLSALRLLSFMPVSSDIATINQAIAAFKLDRLAAIVPVHSHFDHAMDAGRVANRTNALVLGSESTANIARGADVPVDQYQTLADGESRQFGEFSVRLLLSNHAPIGPGNREWFAGSIVEPLRQPASPAAWKTGVTWSIMIQHPRGTSLVQGSGGFIEGRLYDEQADVIFLGVGGLAGLGPDYVRQYWDETVVATGASRVIAVHHDDYTAPFGEVRLFPPIADDVVKTAQWIDAIRRSSNDPTPVELPSFGQTLLLY